MRKADISRLCRGEQVEDTFSHSSMEYLVQLLAKDRILEVAFLHIRFGEDT